jgi:hypothetical protein
VTCRPGGRRPTAVLRRLAVPVVVLGSLTACTDDTGDRDVSACGGRIEARTLDTALPGWTATVGGFDSERAGGGTCSVRRGDENIAEIDVVRTFRAADREVFLFTGKDTSDPPPVPGGLGPLAQAGDDGESKGSVGTVVGPYTISVGVLGADSAAAAVDAAAAIARDLYVYYGQQAALTSASPSPSS